MWRKIELSILRVLYSKGYIRRAKRWADVTHKLALAVIISGLLFKMQWQTKIMI